MKDWKTQRNHDNFCPFNATQIRSCQFSFDSSHLKLTIEEDFSGLFLPSFRRKPTLKVSKHSKPDYWKTILTSNLTISFNFQRFSYTIQKTNINGYSGISFGVEVSLWKFPAFYTLSILYLFWSNSRYSLAKVIFIQKPYFLPKIG